MDRDLFGTDGLRGLAGQYPLDDIGAEQIGMSVGTQFAKPGQRIIIASDPRESSAGLVEAVTHGLTAVGANVTSIGVIPTPGLAYLTREGDEFAAGVMITASHNPYQYNGVKVFDRRGDKLSDASEAALNGLIKKGVTAHSTTGRAAVDRDRTGRYEDFLVGSAGDLNADNLRIAVDSANGAASGLAERVFKRLGAKVTPIFDSPAGRNINQGCGATDVRALCQEVLDNGLDLGIALDGDADRLVMVDNQGREVNGDHLLYLLAVTNRLKGVVTTVMSNIGFEQSLQKKGIKVERTKVGDRYVLEGLARTGFELGGEQSGHIVFPKLLKTGDGLLSAVQVIKALAAGDKTLAEWRDQVEILPQALVNIPLRDRALLDRSEVKVFIAEQADKLSGEGRLLIRPSGTEPLARVMVEASDAQQHAERIAKELTELVK